MTWKELEFLTEVLEEMVTFLKDLWLSLRQGTNTSLNLKKEKQSDKPILEGILHNNWTGSLKIAIVIPTGINWHACWWFYYEDQGLQALKTGFWKTWQMIISMAREKYVSRNVTMDRVWNLFLL